MPKYLILPPQKEEVKNAKREEAIIAAAVLSGLDISELDTNGTIERPSLLKKTEKAHSFKKCSKTDSENGQFRKTLYSSQGKNTQQARKKPTIYKRANPAIGNIKLLVSQGYMESNAREALIKYNNDVLEAKEYLVRPLKT